MHPKKIIIEKRSAKTTHVRVFMSAKAFMSDKDTYVRVFMSAKCTYNSLHVCQMHLHQ